MPDQPDPIAKDDMKKLKYLREKRKPFEALWQDIADYIVPHRTDIAQTAQPGQQQDIKIYNSKGIEALDLAADGLHGYMMSPALQWYKLRMARREFNEMADDQKKTHIDNLRINNLLRQQMEDLKQRDNKLCNKENEIANLSAALESRKSDFDQKLKIISDRERNIIC